MPEFLTGIADLMWPLSIALALGFVTRHRRVTLGQAQRDFGALGDMLTMLHSLNRYIPHFIALSASSPYVQRSNTLFNSVRLNSVFARKR